MNEVTKNETTAERELRIIIAGGGTGGHIFPAIAIANAVEKNKHWKRDFICRCKRKNGNGKSATGRI